jgi:tRNA pseudouridine55 synthase
MENILNIYKPLGMTTFQALEVFKKNNPEYIDTPLAYTGRLDPMAEGVLVVLAGEKRYEAKKYQKLDKEYTAKILFGFSTDSYDLLGLVEEKSNLDVKEENVKKLIEEYQGKIKLSLPIYSSYKIKGKPLFHLAHEGEVNKEDIPEREMIVYKTQFNNFYKISAVSLYKYIYDTINKVKGNFRQKKILDNWKNILKTSTQKEFSIAEINFKVGGGTYIRSIAEDVGKRLGTKALLYHLKRNKVGEFSEKESIKI